MNQLNLSLTRSEKQSALALAGIYACRLLGLFMVLPVLTVYINTLPHATGAELGLAVGIYGLTQALLQIPFGMLSDRFGRKPLIALGFMIFILGSFICSIASQIDWFIVGRAIQGAGAIGSTINALAADLTRPQLRSRVMAFIGIGVGGAFLLAMILGPTLNLLMGVPYLFVISGLLGLIGLFILYRFIPSPETPSSTLISWASFKTVLTNADCLRLDVSIFFLHAALTISFVVMPFVLMQFDLSPRLIGMIYVPILLAAFAMTLPLLRLAERTGRVKSFLTISIAMLGLSQLLLAILPHYLPTIAILLLCFFTAFVFLEANLPALITRTAPTQYRGTAAGIFSSAQFCGIFVGGLVGGILYQHYSASVVLASSAALSLVWLVIVTPLQIPQVEKEVLA